MTLQLFIFLVALLLSALVILALLSRFFPSRPSAPEQLAAATFARAYPGERVAWTRLTATEPDRWIVGVYFGSARPPRFKFFAVSRSSESVAELEDDEEYRPKGWR